MLQSLKNKFKILTLVGIIATASQLFGCIPSHMTYKDEAWKQVAEEQRQMNYKRRSSEGGTSIPQRTSAPGYLDMTHDSLKSGRQEIYENTGRTR